MLAIGFDSRELSVYGELVRTTDFGRAVILFQSAWLDTLQHRSFHVIDMCCLTSMTAFCHTKSLVCCWWMTLTLHSCFMCVIGCHLRECLYASLVCQVLPGGLNPDRLLASPELLVKMISEATMCPHA